MIVQAGLLFLLNDRPGQGFTRLQVAHDWVHHVQLFPLFNLGVMSPIMDPG